MTKLKSADLTPAEQAMATPYRRLLHRLGAMGERLRQGLRHGLDEAVSSEIELAEFSRDELALARSYLQRDLHDLGQFLLESGRGFADWLKFDLALLEEQALHRLLEAADPDRAELERLRDQLEQERNYLAVGELCYPGQFVCISCGCQLQRTQIAPLPYCPGCGENRWRRENEPAAPSP